MAGFPVNVPFSAVALATAGTEKGIVSVKAPTNQDLKLTDMEFMFNGTSGEAEPIQVRLMRITVDSGTATALTEVSKDNRLSGTIQAVCRHTFSALPTVTANTELWVGLAHPQGGILKDVEFKNIWIARGTEVCLLMKIVTGSVVNVTGQLSLEE